MKQIMTILFLFSLVLFSSGNLFAGETYLCGDVRDQHGNLLAGVSVSIEGGSTSTKTDSQGRYLLTLPTIGAYVIVFEYRGYITKRIIQLTIEDEGSTIIWSDIRIMVQSSTYTFYPVKPSQVTIDTPLLGYLKKRTTNII